MLDFKYIERRREQLNLSQAEAARRAGFATRHVWNRLEHGGRLDPPSSTLLKIAKALRCPVGKLLKSK